MKTLFSFGALVLAISATTAPAGAFCFGGNVGIYYVICPPGSFPGNPVGVFFPPFDVSSAMRPAATKFRCCPHCPRSDSEMGRTARRC
jgi:hypothetical protein